MPLYEQAVAIALKAHDGQVRKTDNSPYIIHPLTVAHLVSLYTKDEEIIVAAVLHDVLEDSDWSSTELRQKVGDRVVDVIEAVTEDKNLPWEERKEKYVNSVVFADEAARLVSVADKVHNAITLLRELKEKGEVVWSSFNRGREQKLWFENLLISKLKSVWDHPLLDQYEKLVKEIEGL